MLTLKIIGADGAIKAEHKGMDIKAVYNGTLAEGDAINRKDIIYLAELPLFDMQGNPLK